jgi:hypothetical protein
MACRVALEIVAGLDAHVAGRKVDTPSAEVNDLRLGCRGLRGGRNGDERTAGEKNGAQASATRRTMDHDLPLKSLI